MTKPAASLVDENGNALIEVDPLSGAGQLVALLEYGRRRGFRIGPFVQIGDIRLQVEDLRLSALIGAPPPEEGGIWTQAGFEEGDK